MRYIAVGVSDEGYLVAIWRDTDPSVRVLDPDIYRGLDEWSLFEAVQTALRELEPITVGKQKRATSLSDVADAWRGASSDPERWQRMQVRPPGDDETAPVDGAPVEYERSAQGKVRRKPDSR